jgi:hypothetical protein
MWGFTQLFAHQRDAYLFKSHIFTQPPLARDSAQWQ